MKKTISLLFLLSTSICHANITQISQGCNAFACDLYAQLKTNEGNLFFSPYNIANALAIVYAGAKKETETQMSKVLHNNLPQKEFHSSFAKLIKMLSDSSLRQGFGGRHALDPFGKPQGKAKAKYDLDIASKLFIQDGFKLLTPFVNTIKTNYTDAFAQINFANSKAASDTINRWVSEKTKDKIKKIVSADDFNELTRLVIASAIYFKGKWVKQFKKTNTAISTFHVNKEKKIDVHMMHQTESFKYMESDAFQMVELPYLGDSLSMIIILPKEIDGLKKIEPTLTIENIKKWLAHLKEEKIRVSLPRFKMEESYKLKQYLSQMGMPLAFSNEADFSGIDGTTNLTISKILHKTFIETDEQGTEAAAATAVVMRLKSVYMPMQSFVADHPFIILIKEKQNDLILFMGRVAEPTKAAKEEPVKPTKAKEEPAGFSFTRIFNIIKKSLYDFYQTIKKRIVG